MSDIIYFNGAEISVVIPSADLCKEWLESRPDHQRIVKRGNVSAIAADLVSGNWTFNGATICFDANGSLIDGQHRALAMLESGIYPPVIVVKNISPDSYSDIDSGIARTFADSFKHAGIPNYTTSSSVCIMWSNYATSSLNTRRVSKKQLLETYHIHRESIVWAMSKYESISGLLSESRRVFLLSLGYEKLGEAATVAFFNALESSVGSSAAIAFRRVLVKESNKVRGKFKQPEIIALGIKALKAHMEGKSISLLKWVSDEPFPTIKAKGEA